MTSVMASLGGDFSYIKIANKLDTSEKKALIIKDSYANPLSTYLSLNVSELEVIDLRYFEDEMDMSVSEYIEQSNPDTVIMLYNPSAVSVWVRAAGKVTECKGGEITKLD